jgi:hydrogenase maturation protease
MNGATGGDNPFRPLLAGRAVVVGVGSALRGDDGLGPALVGRLQAAYPGQCIDAGPALENHIGAIARRKPERVLLVDAVHLGRAPGEWEVLECGDLERFGTSTHDLPIAMLCDLIVATCSAEVRVLGVQPATVAVGERLSPVVKRSIGRLETLIGEALA